MIYKNKITKKRWIALSSMIASATMFMGSSSAFAQYDGTDPSTWDASDPDSTTWNGADASPGNPVVGDSHVVSFQTAHAIRITVWDGDYGDFGQDGDAGNDEINSTADGDEGNKENYDFSGDGDETHDTNSVAEAGDMIDDGGTNITGKPISFLTGAVESPIPDGNALDNGSGVRVQVESTKPYDLHVKAEDDFKTPSGDTIPIERLSWQTYGHVNSSTTTKTAGGYNVMAASTDSTALSTVESVASPTTGESLGNFHLMQYKLHILPEDPVSDETFKAVVTYVASQTT